MKNVYIIADIEGSTGCLAPKDAKLFTMGWARACVEVTRDMDAIGRALLDSGIAARVRVKDFHRTGFNLLPNLIDDRIEVDQGYQLGSIPGIGELHGFDTLLMTGMHAASGSDGFIPHTLTSRFETIVTNGHLLSEAELFASSVADAGLIPVFFSGCPTACKQAKQSLRDITTFAVSKPLNTDIQDIRSQLATAALNAVKNQAATVFRPKGPFRTRVKMRGGIRATEKAARLWQLKIVDDYIQFDSADMSQLYQTLIQMAYLHPAALSNLRPWVGAFKAFGRLSLFWSRLLRHQLS